MTLRLWALLQEKSATQAEEIDPDELNLYWWRHLARAEQGNLQPALEDLIQILLRPRNYQQRGHFYHAFEVCPLLGPRDSCPVALWAAARDAALHEALSQSLCQKCAWK